MDWIDIGLHGGAAIASAALFYWWAGGPTVWLNTFFWPAREIYQHWPDIEEVITHPQSLLEWAVPVALAWITYFIMRKIYVHPKYEEGTF